MRNVLLVSIGLALASAAAPTLAGEGSAGFIRAEIGSSDVQVGVDGFGSDSDEDTAALFAGGYWFNRNFALEGRIGSLYNTDLGDDTELDLVVLGVGFAAKHNFGADGTGFFVGGRAGVARMTAQVREDDFDVIDDEHSTKPYYGVGVGYDFSERWGLSLNYDRYQADYDGGVNVDVDAITLGGEFRF